MEKTQKLGGSPRFYEVLDELAQLHSAKNADYSGGRPFGNLLSVQEDFNVPAHIGVFIRMSDKWARIKSFVKKGSLQVKDESVIDSLRDLAVYAIIASILIEDTAKDTVLRQQGIFVPLAQQDVVPPNTLTTRGL